MAFQRSLLDTLFNRMREARKFIQVLAGPRQVGKTTIALALTELLEGLVEYYSADDVSAINGVVWIDRLWESIRIRMKLESQSSAVIIIDEIQKVTDWSAVVKKNWDRDTREKCDIKLVLLGSSRLLLMDGLSESLMGRYELLYAGHWSFVEMQKAFGFSPEQYQWFGGYPGAAELASDELRFKEYIRNSIVEPTMTRDILMTAKIDKPSLLRQLFEIGIGYSAKIVSYNKLLGQLQDAGNTTTLARYLRLLGHAGLISGLDKYSGSIIATKGSIPKFQLHNCALLSAYSNITFDEALANQGYWGGVFENSVGTHLIAQVSKHANASLHYWREGGLEVDYVVVIGKHILGIEVKYGDESIPEKTERRFRERFPEAKLILVGKYGIPYDIFMKAELTELL